MTTDLFDKINGRLEALETENRRLRWTLGVVAAVVFVSAGLLVANRPSTKREVDLRKVVFRDDQGRVRAKLGLGLDGLPGLFFYDDHGNEQVALNIPSDGNSTLQFADRGSPRLTIETTYEGASRVKLLDKAQKAEAGVIMNADSSTAVVLTDGKRGLTAGMQADGRSAVFTTDTDGDEADRLGDSDVTARTLGLATYTPGAAVSDLGPTHAECPVEPPAPPETHTSSGRRMVARTRKPGRPPLMLPQIHGAGSGLGSGSGSGSTTSRELFDN
jgi:hypothetical protein